MLWVSLSSSADQIKQVYHSLALEYHPDKTTMTDHHFLAIQNAWACLRDSQMRIRYNQQQKQQHA